MPGPEGGRLAVLPRVMVAPNGARRGKADHPALPVTITETVATAAACHAAGAGALHAHVRDARGAHSLDPGLYAELLAEMARAVPAMPVQITTEAAGVYAPPAQRALLALRPEGLSAALREILADDDHAAARAFYHGAAEAGVAVQHILYTPEEVDRLAAEQARGTLPAGAVQLLFVLGRYSPGEVSQPADLSPYLARLAATELAADWALCAFGPAETACLLHGLGLGGKARVGFENNFRNADGRVAADNAARVAEIVARDAAGADAR